MIKEYYTAKEIAIKTNRCLSSAYDLINRLNKEMVQKYPNMIVLEKRIPIWYWDEITKKPKDIGDDNNEKN